MKKFIAFLFVASLAWMAATPQQEWIKVPVVGDGAGPADCILLNKKTQMLEIVTTKNCRYVPDLTLLPGVRAFGGFLSDDKSVYYVQVDTSVADPKVGDVYTKPVSQEVQTEGVKVGLEPTKSKPPPTKITKTIDKVLYWMTSIAYAFSGSDNFNRTDSDPLDGNWDSTYTTSAITLQLLSNAVAPSGVAGSGPENVASWTGTAFTADQSSQITISAYTGSTAQVGVILRGNGTDAFSGCVAKIAGTSVIYNNNGGSYNTVAQEFSDTWSTSDTLYCSVVGTNYEMKHSGVSLLTGSDATLATGQPGLFVSDEDVVTNAKVDDWLGEDMGASTTFGVLRRRQ